MLVNSWEMDVRTVLNSMSTLHLSTVRVCWIWDGHGPHVAIHTMLHRVVLIVISLWETIRFLIWTRNWFNDGCHRMSWIYTLKSTSHAIVLRISGISSFGVLAWIHVLTDRSPFKTVICWVIGTKVTAPRETAYFYWLGLIKTVILLKLLLKFDQTARC